MTPAAALLDELRAAGIELRAAGDRLLFRPAGAMTPALAERVKAHKGELLAIVAARFELGDTGDGDKTPGDDGEARGFGTVATGTVDTPDSDAAVAAPPPPPADRPGYLTELTYTTAAGWGWRQRRPDAADRAVLALYGRERGRKWACAPV